MRTSPRWRSSPASCGASSRGSVGSFDPVMTITDPGLRGAIALLEEPSRRSELLNAFPTPVWCADASGECSFVNQAWEDYTGRALEAESGSRWIEAIHPDDRARVRREWDEALGLRRPLETQYRLLRADGE